MNIKDFIASAAVVDRSSFLRSVLVDHIALDEVKVVLEEGIHAVDIDPSVLEKIAKERIHTYALEASKISFCAGSIGGIWMLPADYVQFFISGTQLFQELYYLYGGDRSVLDPGSAQMDALLCMAAGGSGALKSTGSALSACSRFLLKKSGRKLAFRFVPVVGGISSAAFTYTSMVSIANEFVDYLRQQSAAERESAPLMKQIETFIDVEYQEAEAVLQRFCNLKRLKELYQYAEAGYLSDEELRQLKKEL